MKLIACHCNQCRACRRHSRNQFNIVYCKRAGRRKVRQMIHVGKIEMLPEKISLPYFG